MPRDFATRILRALLAVWFVLSVGEPSVVHFCPMHASAAAELASMGLGEASHHAAGHHTHHGMAGESRSPDHHQHQHHCTCIDCCVASASSALAASAVQMEAPRVVVIVAPSPSRTDVLPLDEPPHLRPPSTGPPRA